MQEVNYTYAGVERKLWLCGNENEVYAPNAPWNRLRLMWTILTCVGVGVLAVGLLTGGVSLAVGKAVLGTKADGLLVEPAP